MNICNHVYCKISEDAALVALLQEASPDATIERSILLKLDSRGRVSDGGSETGGASYEEISTIKGLTIHNLMLAIGYASVSGTAAAVVQALKSRHVVNGVLGDRLWIRKSAGLSGQ